VDQEEDRKDSPVREELRHNRLLVAEGRSHPGPEGRPLVAEDRNRQGPEGRLQEEDRNLHHLVDRQGVDQSHQRQVVERLAEERLAAAARQRKAARRRASFPSVERAELPELRPGAARRPEPASLGREPERLELVLERPPSDRRARSSSASCP
jgi:hypothetical protein